MSSRQKEKFTAYCKLKSLIIKGSLQRMGGLQWVIRECWEEGAVPPQPLRMVSRGAAHCLRSYNVRRHREDDFGGASQLLEQGRAGNKKYHEGLAIPQTTSISSLLSTCRT